MAFNNIMQLATAELTKRNKHDLYRNTSFAKTFPEVEELINGFQ